MALTDNLERYYNCDEDAANTTVSDSTGTDDATASTNTSNLSVAGIISNGFEFDSASSETVTVTDSADIDFGTGDFCINCWYKSVGNEVLWSNQDGSPYAGMNIEINASGVYVRLSSGSGTQISANDYRTSSWKMCTLQRDGTDVELYIDGSFINSITSSANVTSSTDFTFSRIGWAGYYDASIDELGIWSRKLTSTEISDLWNSGNGLTYPFTSNVTVNPSAVSLSLTSQVPSYFIDVTKGPVALTLDVKTPTLSLPINYNANVVELTLSVLTPSVDTGIVGIVGTGTIGTKYIATRYPVTEGLIAGTTKQTRDPNLRATEEDSF